MKTLLVTYTDGTTAPFTVPDIEHIGDILCDPPTLDPDREADLAWTIDDGDRVLDLWIRGSQIRSLCLIHSGNVLAPIPPELLET